MIHSEIYSPVYNNHLNITIIKYISVYLIYDITIILIQVHTNDK